MIHQEDSISETKALMTGQFYVQMVADTFATYVQNSEDINRGLTEYRLHLTPQEEQKLWKILDEELVSGKQLKYDFVQEGCAVKTKKLVERVLGKKHIDYSACDPRFSAPQYELVSAAMQHAPWMRFVMLTAMYGHTKQSGCANNLLIPADLAAAWQTATVDAPSMGLMGVGSLLSMALIKSVSSAAQLWLEGVVGIVMGFLQLWRPPCSRYMVTLGVLASQIRLPLVP